MGQVRGLGPRVGGRLALICIYRVNRVYGALVVTSWTCYGALQIIISLLIINVSGATVMCGRLSSRLCRL